MGAQQQQAKLTGETVNPRLLEAQYAVRGDIVARSAEIKSDLKAGKGNYPFKSVVNCNIGNPHVRIGLWLRPSVTPWLLHTLRSACQQAMPGNASAWRSGHDLDHSLISRPATAAARLLLLHVNCLAPGVSTTAHCYAELCESHAVAPCPAVAGAEANHILPTGSGAL